jgi:hypothetical protein
MVMGGVGVKAKDRPIQSLYSQDECIDINTGEINQYAITQYGEEKAPRIIGVLYKSIEIITHWRQWKLLTALDKGAQELVEYFQENFCDNSLSEYQEFINFENNIYG